MLTYDQTDYLLTYSDETHFNEVQEGEFLKKKHERDREAQIVSDNERDVSLYRKIGFTEYWRDPRGFLSRMGEFQELISMQLEL